MMMMMMMWINGAGYCDIVINENQMWIGVIDH